MTHAEIIEMLQILLDNAKVGCADITAIHHVSFDSFKFVIEQTIKALSQEPKWIPVSERLPKDGTYLVTLEGINGKPRIDMMSFAKDLYKVDEFDFPKHKCGWYNYDSEYGYWECTKVIAWMPLPKPYKVESEDEK